jgi:hypothetical protein
MITVQSQPRKIVWKTLSQNTQHSWVLEAHIYNPSYSGGKDQEDGLKPAPGKQFPRPQLKNTLHKKKKKAKVWDGIQVA